MHDQCPHSCQSQKAALRGALLSGENSKMPARWLWKWYATSSKPVVPILSLVGSIFSPVTPAKAGGQGIKQDLATKKNRAAGISRQLPWAPAFAGVTGEKTGVTRERMELTRKRKWMTSLEIHYLLHNQVLRAALFLKTLTCQCFQQFSYHFPWTAVRKSGDQGQPAKHWSEAALLSCEILFDPLGSRFRGGDKGKSINNTPSQTNEEGFSLIEISLALLLIGMLIGAVLKSAPLIEAVQLRAVVKSVDSYRMATQLFVEKYGNLPGDYPKATQTLGPHLRNGNGNGHIEGAGLDPQEEAFWFFQHLSAAGLTPHPGTLEPGNAASFGHGLPKAKVGGGFTVVENPPSHPPMPGLWILLGEQNGVLNNRASLTPSQARQILDLCGEADPLHGSVRALEGINASPQSCLKEGHLNLQQQAATCVVYFKM